MGRLSSGMIVALAALCGCGVASVYFGPDQTSSPEHASTTGGASTGHASTGGRSSTSNSSTGAVGSGGTTGGASSTGGGTSAGRPPIVTTLAGNGVQGFADGSGGREGDAEFGWPMGIGLDALGRIYVDDDWDSRIRIIDLEGNVTTLAGDGDTGFRDGTGGASGSASFSNPIALAVAPDGHVFVADTENRVVREIDPKGNVVTLPAKASEGLPFGQLDSIALDEAGNIYVGDSVNNRICRIDVAGHVSTLAVNGPSGSDVFSQPWGLAVDGAGSVYVSVSALNQIQKIDSQGTVTTFAGSGAAGWADGPSGSAQFNQPAGLAFDPQGNLIVADCNNNRIRRVDPAGNVETIAGNGTSDDTDGTGGPNGSATFNDPFGVAVDPAGNIYVGGNNDHRVRKISF